MTRIKWEPLYSVVQAPLNRLLIEVVHFSMKQLDESGNNLIKRRIQSRDQCMTDAPASSGARRPIFPFHILD